MAAKDADALRANMQLLDVFLDHRAASPFPGDWESVFRGPGYEFWGMRAMERGDSYKQIDWKTRAKTGRYFVREHLAESHAHLAILCDCSRSMAFGQKDLLQADIAVSLAYSAISANNACGIVFFADGIVDAIPARMGLDHFERLLAAVAEREPVACKKNRRQTRAGLCDRSPARKPHGRLVRFSVPIRRSAPLRRPARHGPPPRGQGDPDTGGLRDDPAPGGLRTPRPARQRDRERRRRRSGTMESRRTGNPTEAGNGSAMHAGIRHRRADIDAIRRLAHRNQRVFGPQSPRARSVSMIRYAGCRRRQSGLGARQGDEKVPYYCIFFRQDLFPLAAIRAGWFGIVEYQGGWVDARMLSPIQLLFNRIARQSCAESNPPFFSPVRRLFERMTPRRLGKWWVGLRTNSKGTGANKLRTSPNARVSTHPPLRSQTRPRDSLRGIKTG